MGTNATTKVAPGSVTQTTNTGSTANNVQAARAYPFSHDDDLWLEATAEILLTQKNSNNKSCGTDPEHTNVAFLKQLWQIAYEARISPREFIKDVANRTSFLTRGKTDQAFLQDQRKVAKTIYDKLGEGFQNGYKIAFCNRTEDKKIYAAIETKFNEYKAYEANKAAEKAPTTKPQVKIATEVVTRNLMTVAPKESGSPLLSVGSIVEANELNSNIDKAAWTRAFLDNMVPKKKNGAWEYRTDAAETMQLNPELSQNTLNTLWEIAERHRINPKEFISWLAYNTSLKNNVEIKGKPKTDLISYAEEIARNGFLTKSQAQKIRNNKGQITNYIGHEGATDLSHMIEFLAMAKKLDIKITGKLLVLSKEEEINPITKLKTTQIVTVDEAGKLHIMQFEGTKGKPDLVAYKCQAGVPSIGYGTTILPNGQKVKMGMTTTPEKAIDWFEKDVRRRAEILAEALEGVPVTQKLFNAMVSLSYNVGTAAVLRSECIKCLKRGDLKKANPDDKKEPDKAKEHFMGWRFYTNPKTGQKEESTGLKRRRVKEAVAFDDEIQIELMAEYKQSLLQKTHLASK